MNRSQDTKGTIHKRAGRIEVPQEVAATVCDADEPIPVMILGYH